MISITSLESTSTYTRSLIQARGTQLQLPEFWLLNMVADVAEHRFGRRCDGSMWSARGGSHGLTEASSDCWSRRAETEANAIPPTELRTSAASDQEGRQFLFA